LPSLGLTTTFDHDNTVVSQSALTIVSGFQEVAGCPEQPETVSKLYIFPNVFKMKRHSHVLLTLCTLLLVCQGI
jgi:hypothetical protein